MNSNGARTAEDRRTYNDAPDAALSAKAPAPPTIARYDDLVDRGGAENHGGANNHGANKNDGVNKNEGVNNDGAETTVAVAPELRSLCDQVAGLVNRLPGRLRRIAVGDADHFVEIEWHGDDQAVATSLPPPLPSGPLGLVRPPAPVTAGTAADDGPAVDLTPEPGHVVVAPLVGTFYRAPEPGAPAFVEVGDLVEPGQTIGIVEAMKLMNPIVSETAGRISAIYVGNGQGVEFGEDLIRVSTDPD